MMQIIAILQALFFFKVNQNNRENTGYYNGF